VHDPFKKMSAVEVAAVMVARDRVGMCQLLTHALQQATCTGCKCASAAIQYTLPRPELV
jgi:hypothetical protein